MVRRSFRIGLRLGLLFGVSVAVVRTLQSRRTAAAVPPPAPWEPIVDTPRATPPSRPVPPAQPELLDEVGEPILEPSAPEPRSSWTPSPTADAPVPAQPPATPPEEDILHAKSIPADEIVPADDIVPVLDTPPTEPMAPVKKAAAKREPAAKRLPPGAAKAPAKKAAKKATARVASLPGFVEPEAGTCPPTHPVKAKLASRLFHLPGMFAYDRTRPDRCYLDGPTAVADGFTSAKR